MRLPRVFVSSYVSSFDLEGTLAKAVDQIGLPFILRPSYGPLERGKLFLNFHELPFSFLLSVLGLEDGSLRRFVPEFSRQAVDGA